MTAAWSAYVAPVGVLSEDGRQLSRDVEWSLFQQLPAPLLRLEPREVLGTVEEIATERAAVVGMPWTFGCLVARGRLAEGVDPDGLVDLLPQIEIHGPAGVNVDIVFRTITFTSGQIRAVVLGDAPAWPGLWFRVDDVVAAAPPVTT